MTYLEKRLELIKINKHEKSNRSPFTVNFHLLFIVKEKKRSFQEVQKLYRDCLRKWRGTIKQESFSLKSIFQSPIWKFFRFGWLIVSNEKWRLKMQPLKSKILVVQKPILWKTIPGRLKQVPQDSPEWDRTDTRHCTFSLTRVILILKQFWTQ